MSNYYWDEDKMKLDLATPTMMGIGDSWFWYVFRGGSLINNIGDIVESMGHILLAKGMNGAEAYDYVDGKYARSVKTALDLYGSNLAAVLISGGGNDFAGFNDMRPLLKPTCSAETTAPGCFRTGPGGLEDFMAHVDLYYRKLIGLIYTHTKPGCKIIMHTYDYSIPNGIGVFGSHGWLKPAMMDAGVPAQLQQACVKFLLDAFYDVLDNIRKTDPKNLDIVDSRGTLLPNEWANELHPTGAGFKKIAYERWKPVLKKHGLAA